MIIKRVDPTSAACCFGLIFTFWGVMTGVAALFQFASVYERVSQAFPYVIQTVIFAPFVYGFGGFIFGLLSAFIFNLTNSWYGGLIVETDEERKKHSKKSWEKKIEEPIAFIKEPE